MLKFKACIITKDEEENLRTTYIYKIKILLLTNARLINLGTRFGGIYVNEETGILTNYDQLLDGRCLRE